MTQEPQQFISPSKKLYHLRHRVTRDQLQHTNLTDWSTIHDLTIDNDIQLVSHAVPFVGPPDLYCNMTNNNANNNMDLFSKPPSLPIYNDSQHSMSTVSTNNTIDSNCNRHISYSQESISESSIFSTPSLASRLRNNISVDSLIQENKRRISDQMDSLNMFVDNKETDIIDDDNIETHHNNQLTTIIRRQTNQDLLKLKYDNRHLLKRKFQLDKIWNNIRKSWKDGTILITLKSLNMYWFGLPVDLRFHIYQLCLYDIYTGESIQHSNKMYQALSQCIKLDTLAKKIWLNLSREENGINCILNSNNTNNVNISSTIIESKFFTFYQGLYYHLRDHLKLNILQDFIIPLLRKSLYSCLSTHANDGMALELLDIFIFSMYYNQLSNVVLIDFLFAVLEQTYFKFFNHDLIEFINQLKSINNNLDLVQILESLRKNHDKQIMEY
ncbi:Mlo50p NDAI_0C06350 [Naumovozyma dairenensis CBS 421]|uniref:Uncharacterized protein n=1 Tax=Naumovozyma dairenensis (strain ATCC 10597 / BCRC 20456 / CBS 421 / NBRC 0211 / NRRL Y-12639) TaxID=1071378 RepID=G0W933_NAUDC|nr:hypothetical protein NDAI_0C06350 [Naumovozyma dairenensis CBS 421]CCD24294.1 hypothetical protein NDAI_0C06350 [Naumovozyma dairenensis CBS 421]